MIETPEHAVERYLRTRARPALLLHRATLASPLDAPGGTYLGGLPKLPQNLQWPTTFVDGSAAGLLFAGQIDLSEAAIDGTPLPSTGTLYFFYQDTWEMGETRDGIMPSAVLYHPESSATLTPRAAPPRLVPLNDAAGDPPRFFKPGDPRASRSQRFDLVLRRFESFPDYYSDDAFNELPSGKFAWSQRLLLERMLARHPRLPWRTRPIASIKAFGLSSAWKYTCQALFEETQRRLVASSEEHALGPAEKPENGADWFRFPIKADWVFAWFVIEAFARGVLTPASWEQVAKLDESEPPSLSRAREWLRVAKSTELDQPPESVRKDFICWISEIEVESRAWPFGMRSRLSGLWQRIVTYAVGMAFEARSPDVIPRSLIEHLENHQRAVVTNGHQMLGWGSSDHTVAPPSARAEKVLLLKLSCEDGLLKGSGSEGAFQYWIDREALARADFSAVELTC